MSGPIIRKYGFPNFEKIFGPRAPQHGIDDERTTPEAGPRSGSVTAPVTEPEPAAPAAEKTESREKP
jgi:hypothetical protein